MKTKKKVIIGITVLVLGILVGLSISYFINNKKEDTKEIPIVDIKKESKVVIGYIDSIDDKTIILHDESNIKYTIKVDSNIIMNAKVINPKDYVKVFYKEELNSNKDPIAYRIDLLHTAVTLDRATEILNTMSLEEKVGQMFFVRTPEFNASQDALNYNLGGYILFGRDVINESKDSLKSTISSYQNNSKIKMIIAVDEEGGTVNRLSNYKAFRGQPFLSPQELYNQGGIELILSDSKEKAELLLSLGINVNLAPVADISTNSNDFIYQRSLGKNTKETSNYITQLVKEMDKNHLGSVLKHFPGYGNNIDTHTGIATDKRTYQNFLDNDFKPFESGIDVGAKAILVSHNIVTSMDDKMPASLSSKVHKILRKDLHFHGVIMTDDLDMGAINQFTDHKKSAVLAIQAGNDFIMCGNYKEQIPAVLQAIKDNTIKEQTINESVHRILSWKLNLKVIE
ncbi:MAG: glycoside hydrolase family 3 N-terminal domain-containing protein [Erysipelotrichaceae bacterium]